MVKHIVCFKLKPETTEEQKEALIRELGALKEKVNGIIDFSAGINISPENKSKGFNFGFIMTFADVKSRDEYLPHPAHKAVGANFIRPISEESFVFDYEV